MPNTLAHIAVNTLAIKPVTKHEDLFWIYFSCIIPDIPWILQRIINTLAPTVDSVDMRLYSIAQASLFMCILLSAALALFSPNWKRTFYILSAGSLVHLVLDATQTKWANGIHLFAPFSWNEINFGFYWPENNITLFLTGAGLLTIILFWKKLIIESIPFYFSKKRLPVIVVLFCGYMALPFLVLDDIKNSNSHFVKTLSNSENRAGKPIEIDRAEFFEIGNEKYISNSITREKFNVTGIDLNKTGKISIKGEFKDNNTILVKEYHKHSKSFRDMASVLGIFCILVYTVLIFARIFQTQHKSTA